MYREFFGLHEAPFSLTPDTGYFFAYGHYRDALDTLLVALEGGEGFIKVTGEVGTGKTLLCRKLLNTLGEGIQTAYIPNPYLTAPALNLALADELGLELPRNLGQHRTLKAITERLIELARDGKQVVLCVDEAQAMPDETLEALRLLTNLETEKRKLLQVVLFGQPELDERLSRPSVRQLRQRITFAYRLEPLDREGTAAYITHRLAVAGNQGGLAFTAAALRRLHRASGGIPRLVNILAHKSLLAAYGKGTHTVTPQHVKLAIADTESVRGRRASPRARRLFVAATVAAGVVGFGLAVDLPEPLWPFATATSAPQQTGALSNQDWHLARAVPSRLTGSREPQSIVLEGQGLQRVSGVEVRWTGNQKRLDPEQIRRIDDRRIAIVITTGTDADVWTAQAIADNGQRSNAVSFSVVPPESEVVRETTAGGELEQT